MTISPLHQRNQRSQRELFSRKYTDQAPQPHVTSNPSPARHNAPSPNDEEQDMERRALVVSGTDREPAWRQRLARTKQMVTGFYQSEAVSVATFYAWPARLGIGALSPEATRHGSAPNRVAVHFIALGSISPPSTMAKPSRHASPSHQSPHHAHACPSASSAIDIRLDLAGVGVLHIARH